MQCPQIPNATYLICHLCSMAPARESAWQMMDGLQLARAKKHERGMAPQATHPNSPHPSQIKAWQQVLTAVVFWGASLPLWAMSEHTLVASFLASCVDFSHPHTRSADSTAVCDTSHAFYQSRMHVGGGLSEPSRA